MTQARSIVIGVAPSEGLDQCLDEYEHVVVLIDRREVEACETGRVVAALMALTDSTERVRKYEGALVVAFQGYDDDPRAVWETPDVVRFFAKVHAQWPYWLHFLVRDPRMFGVLLLLIMQRQALKDTHSRLERLPMRLNAQAVADVLMELFVPMNTLYETHGVSEADNRRVTDLVVDLAIKGLA